MDNPLDQTTLATISLLEARLLRIEHVLYGQTAPSHPAGPADSAILRMKHLERRFSMMISHIRVYGELLKICESLPLILLLAREEHSRQKLRTHSLAKRTVLTAAADKSNPDLFHAPNASAPPSQLSIHAIQSIVLASASAFPATVSCLTAIQDSPIPDPAESASLITLAERMKAMEVTQLAQAAEVAELRQRSEAAMRAWYEQGVLANSQSLADMESRAQGVERSIRRREVALAVERRI
ncbi:hypothetical protein E4U41_006991 [Claviceps citrina]|nr:hypothetical protein E4U41_006991 [Claviceps citrina]